MKYLILAVLLVGCSPTEEEIGISYESSLRRHVSSEVNRQRKEILYQACFES